MQQDAERKRVAREIEVSQRTCGIAKLPKCVDTHHSLANIHDALVSKPLYTILELNPLLPQDRKEKYETMKRLKETGLPWHCCVYSQTHTGSIENMHFIWKLEELTDPQLQAGVIEEVHRRLPVYHSKAVRDRFRLAANKLSIKPMHSRYLYKLATSDANASANEKIGEIDQRVMEYINYQDEDVVMDLRSIHQSGPSHYNRFFSVAAQVIENTVGSAVDDRRHGDTPHLAAALSATDLHRFVMIKYMVPETAVI